MPPLAHSFLKRPLAHRGLHDVAQGRVENAPLSIAAAVQHGYGIEIDVQMSRDGQAMVFHDEKLDRLTGQIGLVNQLISSDLEKIHLTHTTDTIPSLKQILKLVAGKSPLLIEIKDQDGALGPNVGRLERAVLHDIADYTGDVALMSFNPHSIAAINALNAPSPLGLVTDRFTPDDWPMLTKQRCEELRKIQNLHAIGASFISHNHDYFNDEEIAHIISHHPILCWTIRSPLQAQKALKIADNITFEGYLA